MEEQLTTTHNHPWIIMLLLAVCAVLSALIGANARGYGYAQVPAYEYEPRYGFNGYPVSYGYLGAQ